MPTSIFLARLIGPVLLVAAIAMIMNAAVFRTMAREFLGSAPLVFLSGVLAMTAGLAIVLHHNLWTADWRVIITLFGWAAAIGGAARIALPGRVKSIGEAMLGAKPWVTTGAGAAWIGIGAVLCVFGYLR